MRTAFLLLLGLLLVVVVHPGAPFTKRHILYLKGNASLGYYYTNILIGTPPQTQSVIVDTGSGLLALPCSKCVNCGSKHINPLLNLEKSSSNKYVTCDRKQSERSCLGGCKSSDSTESCTFRISYAEGSEISGLIVSDTIRFEDIDGEEIRTSFGCTTKQSNLFLTQQANGIMGFAPIRSSSLLESMFKKHSPTTSESYSFSLCLASNGGVLNIGAVDSSLHKGQYSIKTTFKSDKNLYSLDNAGEIRVGSKVMHKKGNSFGAYGIFVDSGSTETYFQSNEFAILKEALDEACRKSGRKCQAGTDGKNKCFKLSFENENWIDRTLRVLEKTESGQGGNAQQGIQNAKLINDGDPSVVTKLVGPITTEGQVYNPIVAPADWMQRQEKNGESNPEAQPIKYTSKQTTILTEEQKKALSENSEGSQVQTKEGRKESGVGVINQVAPSVSPVDSNLGMLPIIITPPNISQTVSNPPTTTPSTTPSTISTTTPSTISTTTPTTTPSTTPSTTPTTTPSTTLPSTTSSTITNSPTATDVPPGIPKVVDDPLSGSTPQPQNEKPKKVARTLDELVMEIFPSIEVDIGSQTIHWAPTKYFLLRSLKNKEICLGVASMDRTLLGANFIVNMDVNFDLKQNTVEFFPDSTCLNETFQPPISPFNFADADTPLEIIEEIYSRNKMIVLVICLFVVITILILCMMHLMSKGEGEGLNRLPESEDEERRRTRTSERRLRGGMGSTMLDGSSEPDESENR